MILEAPESKPEVKEGALPTPTFEEPSAVSSPSMPDAKSLAKEVASLLMPDIEKKLQSTKDKRFDRLEKAIGLSELEEMGVSIPENVKQEYRLRDMQKKLDQLSAPAQEASTAKGVTMSNDEIAQIIKDAGVDVTKPEGIALLSGRYRNRDHFEAEALKLGKRQSQPQTTSPADAGTLNAPPPSTDKSPDSLVKEYREKMLAARGKRDQILALKDEYKKKGVPVEQVIF